MIRLTPQPITAEAFAPFGQVLPPGGVGGPRLDLVAELQNLRATAKPRLSVAAVAAKPLPLAAVEMERHVHSSQAFVPLDCATYLVLVAPRAADGSPDVSRLRAFRVPGDTGINYCAGTWHHPLTPLERNARFAVLTFVDGTAADEEFVPTSQHVMIDPI